MDSSLALLERSNTFPFALVFLDRPFLLFNFFIVIICLKSCSGMGDTG
jgi:hypothetical protein